MSFIHRQDQHKFFSAYRLFLLLTLLLILIPSSIKATVTERVVLVIIDGLRYSEGLGDPNHEQVPRMAALAEQGSLISNFRNDGFTYTSRAIPAIWCGAWTETISFTDTVCDGYSNKYAALPTVFEYYRKQLNRPADDCVYTLKALCPWKASFDADYGPDYWPLYHSEGEFDLDVWHETRDVIAEQSPHFLLMYLADVDHAGHGGVWDDYLTTIVRADSIVGELWDVLQADSAYAGKTTMLVTNDHGRHDYDFTGHGDDCEGCRHIQLLAIGPDIRQNFQSEVVRTIPDITPTIGALLGFTAEQATGTVMEELFDPTVSLAAEPQQHLVRLTVFPNPANGQVTIDFTVMETTDLTIDIFDLRGRKIRTLNHKQLSPGSRQLTWDSNNSQGKAVPSGTYLLRLTTNSGTDLAKVMLLK